MAAKNGEVRTCYSCTVSTNGAELQESEPGNSDACVAGEQSAWVRAVAGDSPRHSRCSTGLRTRTSEPVMDSLKVFAFSLAAVYATLVIGVIATFGGR